MLGAALISQLSKWAHKSLRDLQLLTSVPIFGALLAWVSVQAPQDSTLELMQTLGSHRLSRPELHQLLEAARERRGMFIKLLRSVTSSKRSCASVVFEGYGNFMKLGPLTECVWPPPHGFSIACWCYVADSSLGTAQPISAGVCMQTARGMNAQ